MLSVTAIFVWLCTMLWNILKRLTPLCPNQINSPVDPVARYYERDTVYPKKYAHVFALLCFVVVIHWLIFTYPSGLLHWHCGNLTIAPVPAKQPWWIWINTSCEFIMNDCVTTTKQRTTKPCAYFLGYTVCLHCIPDISLHCMWPMPVIHDTASKLLETHRYVTETFTMTGNRNLSK